MAHRTTKSFYGGQKRKENFGRWEAVPGDKPRTVRGYWEFHRETGLEGHIKALILSVYLALLRHIERKESIVYMYISFQALGLGRKCL